MLSINVHVSQYRVYNILCSSNMDTFPLRTWTSSLDDDGYDGYDCYDSSTQTVPVNAHCNPDTDSYAKEQKLQKATSSANVMGNRVQSDCH